MSKGMPEKTDLNLKSTLRRSHLRVYALFVDLSIITLPMNIPADIKEN